MENPDSSHVFGVFTYFWFPLLLNENVNIWLWSQWENQLKSPWFYLCVRDPNIDGQTAFCILPGAPSPLSPSNGSQWFTHTFPGIGSRSMETDYLLVRYGIFWKWMSWVSCRQTLPTALWVACFCLSTREAHPFLLEGLKEKSIVPKELH